MWVCKKFSGLSECISRKGNIDMKGSEGYIVIPASALLPCLPHTTSGYIRSEPLDLQYSGDEIDEHDSCYREGDLGI